MEVGWCAGWSLPAHQEMLSVWKPGRLCLLVATHGAGWDGDPVLEQLEEHLPGARSLYYSYIFGSIGTLNRLHDAGHYQHRLGGGPIHINNIIAINLKKCLVSAKIVKAAGNFILS